MVMAVAAAEATVGLAIVIAIYRNKKTPLVDEYDAMSPSEAVTPAQPCGRPIRALPAARASLTHLGVRSLRCSPAPSARLVLRRAR